MKTAIYVRVSTTEQTTQNQEIRLLEYVKERNLDYDIFKETESTRKTRPVKAALLNALRKGEYTSVIVYKLDRWARSFTELILEITELTGKGISFHSYSEQLDFSTATGKLHFQILSAFAEFERALISERTKEGIRRAKSQGKKVGRPQGSKDNGKRKIDGYLERERKKRSKQTNVCLAGK